jgi:hypothetical protein
MKYTYELIEDTNINSQSIKRVDEEGNESFIPIDPANSDYQAYLKYLEENK